MTAIKINNYPWEIHDVEPELTAEYKKYFKNEQTNYVRVGPKGYFFPGTFVKNAANIYNLQIRTSDILVNSYPRSGTNWVCELVWTVANDFVKCESKELWDRFLLLERNEMHHPLMIKHIAEETSQNVMKLSDFMSETRPEWKEFDNRSSPRFAFSHLALSLLPPTLLDTGKVIYIARDPRDVAVSFYHLNRLHKVLAYEGDFKTFWKLFINNSTYWSPIFEHIKESWEMRHHPNMLFLFYEDLHKNMPAIIRQVATFLNKPYSEEQVADLCEHLQFDNFKKNKLLNLESYEQGGALKSGEQPFIRKGKVGGWREYFDEEMSQQADQWIADNLRNTDLRFPDVADE